VAVPIIYSPKDHRRVVSVKAKLAPKINSERVIKTTMTEFTEEVIGHTANFLPLLDRFIELPYTNLLQNSKLLDTSTRINDPSCSSICGQTIGGRVTSTKSQVPASTSKANK
jgi:hypothetical protein